MRVLQQVVRLYVATEDLDNTIRFYEELQYQLCERRTKIPETGVEAAKVGGFLILAGEVAAVDAIRDARSGHLYLDARQALGNAP